MRTPNIERIKVGDYYVYTTEIESLKNIDDNELYDILWSDKYLGRNYNDEGVLEDQGPGVHATIDLESDMPNFLRDGFYFSLAFARSLRAIEGKSLDLINSSAWVIAAQDDHTPYWHSHRRNIDDPRLPEGSENVDSTYSFSMYLNKPECGSPFSDLLFAHKEDVVSMPITKGKLCFFDGDLFHKPQLVPKEFGWRYVVACDFLFDEE